MYGLLVSAVLLATVLLPVHDKRAIVPEAAELASSQVPNVASPLLYDRLSIAKRLLNRSPHRQPMMTAERPAVVPPIAGYRTIRRIDFLVPGGVVNQYSYAPNGYVSGINNLGQISYSACLCTLEPPYKVLPAYVINDDGTHTLLSESVLTPLEGPGFDLGYIEANALNDVGGVAGDYYYSFTRADGSQKNFLGNLGWLDTADTYRISYFDGYDYGADAYAINNNNVAVGMTGQPDATHLPQAAYFSKTVGRRALLPLQNPACPKPQYERSQATGINDAGVIVGYEETAYLSGSPCNSVEAVRFNMNGYAQPLFPSQPPTTTGSFTINRSVAEAINERGDIVGYAGAGQLKAFLYKAACNCVTFIPRPIGENVGSAEAFALNASDDVVGAYIDDKAGANTSTAFLATRGRTYDINSLLPPNSGWTITNAIGINDAREIIGFGLYQDPITKKSVPAAFAMKP